MRARFLKSKMISLILMILAAQMSFAQSSGIFGKLGQKPSNNLTESGPVLWNQIDEPGSGFIVSQEFTNPENETETSIAADDFIVPEGDSWDIGSIAFVGSFFDYGVGPVDTFNVVFYDNAPGMPGSELYEFYDVIGFTAEEELINNYTVVTYKMKLPNTVTLPEGQYWMSVQAKGSQFEMGKWGWNDYWAGSQPSLEHQWHWKNPLDGLATGYVDWTPAITVAAIFLQYDLTFALYEPAFDNDLAMVELVSPAGGEGLTNAEAVTVKIKNEGSLPQSGFDLKYVFNGVEVIENIGAVSIDPEEFYEYTFTQTVDMEMAGPYEFEVAVLLTGDEYPENDMLETTRYSYGDVYIMENGNTSATITTCSGTSVDPGGLYAPFEQNDFGTVTFYPATAGSQVRLTFIEFDIQWAEMELYDGEDITAPSFGIFNKGTGSPGVITAFNESGALTMRFEGSGWDYGPGWVAFISCFDPAEDDFAVLDISLSMNTIIAGDFITASATIQNFGTTVQAKDVSFTANGEEFGLINTGDLEPWQTTVVEAEWNPVDPGVYTIMASVPDDEGIDDNNTQSMEQEVLDPTILIEGFENEDFPPEGWTLTTGAWVRTTSWPMFGVGMANAFTTPAMPDTLISPMLQIEAGDVIDFYAQGSWWWPGDLELVYRESTSDAWISLEYWGGFDIPASPTNLVVDLNDYAGQDGQVGFVAHGNVAWWDIGDVSIDEIYGPKKKLYANNLAAYDFTGTASPNANEPTTYNFTIKNTGTADQVAGSYTVKLMNELGEELASVDGLDIQVLQEVTYALEHSFTETGQNSIYGYIDFLDDELPGDNTSNSLTIYIQQEGTQQVQIGEDDQETWNYPLGTSGAYRLTEMLYKNDEIGLSGIMNGISFFYRSNEALPIEDYPVDIYVGETLEDELPSGTDWITANDLTLVFSGTLDMFPGDNMIYIPFDEPYNYAGDNLVVMTYKTDADWYGDVIWYCHSTTEMQTKWASEYNFVPDPYDPSPLYPFDEYIRPNARIYVLPTQGEYCAPQTQNGTSNGFFIDGVNLNALSNVGTGSQGGPDYNDYTSMSTNLQLSKYYELTIDVNTDGNGGAVAAWIDYNNDSDFDDEGEKICQVNGVGASFSVTVPVVVPDDIGLGIKRLRIRAGDFSTFINSCETIDNGEGEDYLVNVTQTLQVYNPVTALDASLSGTDVELTWGVPVNPGQAFIESFEMTAWPPENWEIKHSTSLTDPLMDPVDVSWEQTGETDYVYNGNAAAICPAEAPDFNWLISPEFMVYGDDAIRFGMHYTADAGGYSKFYVLLEVDGTWETLLEYTDEIAWQNHYEEMVTADITEYAGHMVKMAFVTQNNAAYPVAIDDVIIFSSTNLSESFAGLTGYDLYRNGEMISQIDDPALLSFSDVVSETDNYSYCVAARYNTETSEVACDEVFYLTPLTPPLNLNGYQEEADVFLNWSAPDGGIMRFNDDFESYTAGMQVALQNPDDWSTWTNDPGGAEDPYVTDVMAYSGDNSVLIENLADLLWLSDEVKTEGRYSFNFKLYIPEGYNAYFNVLQQYVYTVGAEWGFQAFFDQYGNGYIDANGQNSASFVYEYDTWMYIELDIDLDLDWAEFMINGESIHAWPWSAGIFGGNDLNQLQAADFYAWNINGVPKFYIDDVSLMEVFEPGYDLTYNVYRDGSVLDIVGETSYTDVDVEPGDYSYYVTALYDEGESDPSNVFDITVVQPPFLPFFEDFESFTAGEQVACQDPETWTTWSSLPCDPTEDAYVSEAQAYSGANSVVIVDDNDLVLPFEEYYTSGTYKASFWMYIPSGKDAYWNVLQDFDGGNSTWGLEVFFDGGNGSISVDDVTFDYAFDEWMLMELYVNLDEDGAQFLIDGENVHFWNWTNGGINQFAAFDFYGWTLSSGSCEYYFDDLMIEETEWTMPVLAAPSNLEAEVSGTDVHLTWEAPTSDLLMLSQHDNSPYSGYYQEYGWGYGVVYDLSAYSASTVEKIDFRHTSYGIMGTWDYKVHIVDWDAYTEIAEAGPFQTTVNDDWEFDVDLGSVASSGGLVGIFIEPMGNDPANAYPVVDWDVALDGSSVYGILSDYSNFVAAGGDFLINLWIMGASDGKYVQAPIVKVNGTGQAASRNAVNPFVGDELEVKQMVTGMSELLGYNVYRDDVIIANTNEEMYDDLGLPAGQYAYHVTAVYDLGESGPSNTVLVDIITGVEQAVSDEFRIYPNPVSDYIFLESMQPIKRVVMYNANGQVVVNELVSDQETHKIDAGDLNTGIYNIRIETENGWINKKVIKK